MSHSIDHSIADGIAYWRSNSLSPDACVPFWSPIHTSHCPRARTSLEALDRRRASGMDGASGAGERGGL